MFQSEKEPSIPAPALIKLFDYTGNTHGGNKGYFLFYVDKDGDPSCVARFSDATTEMSLIKAIEVLADRIEGDTE